MEVSTISRRAILGASIAATLPFLNPGRAPGGQFHLIRPAHAWIQVAALALSAISAFSKSEDGGLGAYLTNIKQLSEENIRLSQDILARVASLQASMAELPERMRRLFIEVRGYDLASETQTALNYILLVEAETKGNPKLNREQRERCEKVTDICARIAGARAVPYGIGGTAATCIAMVTALDARAHYFLGRSQRFPQWVRIAYLPWVEAMLVDQDSSVMRSFREEGELLASMTNTVLSGLQPSQREAMQAQWNAIVTADAGASSGDFTLACGSYGVQTGSNRGRCMRSVCDFSITAVDPERLDTALPAHLRRVLEAARLTPSEVIALSPVPNDRLIAPALANQPYREIPPHCYCDSYEKIPVYTPASDSQLVGKLRSVGSDDGTSYVALEKHWTARAPAQCGSVVNGTDGSAAGQDVAIQAQLKPLEDALTKFENGDLSAYNAQRALVFTTYKLLDATRSTRSALARLAA